MFMGREGNGGSNYRPGQNFQYGGRGPGGRGQEYQSGLRGVEATEVDDVLALHSLDRVVVDSGGAGLVGAPAPTLGGGGGGGGGEEQEHQKEKEEVRRPHVK